MNKDIDTKLEELTSKKRNKFKIFLFLFFLIIIFFYLYIRYFETNYIVVNEQAIIDENLPDTFNGFKIVHFSDIHYGTTMNINNIKKVVKKINELNPDILVFTGDLFDEAININDNDVNDLKNILKDFNVKFKKYAVVGDQDYINKNAYLDIMNTSGFIVLDNSSDLLYYQGNIPLEFIGTPSILNGENDIFSASMTNQSDLEYYKIWLNHEPTLFDDLIDNDLHPNILLAGHTLGGLVNIPFYGYLLNQEGINNYKEAYYHKKKISMYISKGLGTHKLKIRFLNPSSINLYRLYNK